MEKLQKVLFMYEFRRCTSRLITGKGDGTIDLQGTANRVKVATLLTNFCKKTG